MLEVDPKLWDLLDEDELDYYSSKIKAVLEN